MNTYSNPDLKVIELNSSDIIATSVTSTEGNVFNGPVIGGHGNAMAPENHRIWGK